MEQLLRLGEVAHLLGVHPDTIKYHERKGNIKPFRNHARVRFLTKEDFEKLKEMFTPKQQAEEANA